MATEKYLPEGSDENQFDSEELPLAPFPDGIQDSERYPDTKHWSEQQKAEYLEKNKPLIRSIISRIRNIPDAALSQDDLFQEAQLAFWLALDTYNPRKRTLFTTYAHKCMRNAVNGSPILQASLLIPDFRSLATSMWAGTTWKCPFRPSRGRLRR